MSMDALCVWPGKGSVWLHDAHYETNEQYGEIIQGDAYEEISGPNIPDGSFLDRYPMWFPRSCVLKEEE